MEQPMKKARKQFTGAMSALATASISAFALVCTAACGSSPAAAQSPSTGIIYLNQAWSQDDREWYYHFSQGSAVLSYDIFLDLEVGNSQELFRSDANSIRY